MTVKTISTYVRGDKDLPEGFPGWEPKVIRMGFAFNAVETETGNLRCVHIDHKCDRLTAEEIVKEMRAKFKPEDEVRFVVTEMPIVYEEDWIPKKEEAK